MSKANEPAHTPGPWKYEEHKSNNSKLVTDYIIRGGEEQYIADVHISIKPEIEHEGEANARLIAAAPGLLEALKLCLSALDPENYSGHIGNNARTAGHAAIARAEGRE